MGERSQIYIRYRVKNTKRSAKYTVQGCMAVYHQWSFGERMISRCRGIIERLERMGNYPFMFETASELRLLRQTVDTNFDMRDIIASVDLADELREYGQDIFQADSNHGHIYIDITAYGDDTAPEIRYAFSDGLGSGVLGVTEFANHDIGNDTVSDDDPLRLWFQPSEYDSRTAKSIAEFGEMVKYTRENIDYIDSHAKVMNEADRDEFVKWVRKSIKESIGKETAR